MQKRPKQLVPVSLSPVVLIFTLAIVVSFLAGAGRLLAAPRGEIEVGPVPSDVSRSETAPDSAVLLIGDGMGYAHLDAAESRSSSPRLATRFASQADLVTVNVRGRVTDSAASATAMATGQKVYNGVVSQARPGDGDALPTVVDAFEAAGKSIGIVTTSDLTHATPAAFVAHAASRRRRRRIAAEMIETRPAVMIGGGHQALGLEALRGAGYTVFDSLPANQTLERATLPVAVVLGEGHLPYWTDAPETDARATLAEMTLSALELLSSNPRGFLLVVEGARIDHASHSNDFDRMIGEATDFVAAVHAALDWREEAAARELLIVATSDHETGGLSIADAGVDGEIPTAQWSTRRHTARLVPLFAIGPGSERVESTMDNTDVFSLLVGR